MPIGGGKYPKGGTRSYSTERWPPRRSKDGLPVTTGRPPRPRSPYGDAVRDAASRRGNALAYAYKLGRRLGDKLLKQNRRAINIPNPAGGDWAFFDGCIHQLKTGYWRRRLNSLCGAAGTHQAAVRPQDTDVIRPYYPNSGSFKGWWVRRGRYTKPAGQVVNATPYAMLDPAVQVDPYVSAPMWDPNELSPFLPQDDPQPLPWIMQRMRLRAGLQWHRDVGNDVLGRPDTAVPAPDPSGPPDVVIGPHIRLRPGKGTKEHKSKFVLPRIAAQLINVLTEASDLLDAAYYALPWQIRMLLKRKKGVVNPYDKALALYQNWGLVDWVQLFHNILMNQFLDYVGGRMGRYQRSEYQRIWAEYGVNIQSITAATRMSSLILKELAK